MMSFLVTRCSKAGGLQQYTCLNWDLSGEPGATWLLLCCDYVRVLLAPV